MEFIKDQVSKLHRPHSRMRPALKLTYPDLGLTIFQVYLSKRCVVYIHMPCSEMRRLLFQLQNFRLDILV